MRNAQSFLLRGFCCVSRCPSTDHAFGLLCLLFVVLFCSCLPTSSGRRGLSTPESFQPPASQAACVVQGRSVYRQVSIRPLPSMVGRSTPRFLAPWEAGAPPQLPSSPTILRQHLRLLLGSRLRSALRADELVFPPNETGMCDCFCLCLNHVRRLADETLPPCVSHDSTNARGVSRCILRPAAQRHSQYDGNMDRPCRPGGVRGWDDFRAALPEP